MGTRPIDILLVEDNPDHAELIFKEIGDKIDMIRKMYLAKDGQEALDYLFRKGVYKDPNSSPKPGLVLLDLKLPKVDGVEVLKRIRSDSGLKELPVVILTTSSHEEDIAEGYKSGTNYYITKPIKSDKLIIALEKLDLI